MTTNRQPGDPTDQELIDHFMAEFDARGREAVGFLESARSLLEGHAEPDPGRANSVAYCVREALKRLLPPDSNSGTLAVEQYLRASGEVYHDGARRLRQWYEGVLAGNGFRGTRGEEI